MRSDMLTEQHLREVLREMRDATEVDAHREGSKLIAIVVSPAFDDMEEHARQAWVWNMLLERLTDEEQADIGYVFTNTPAEKATAEDEGVEP